ncbi:zinc metalloproteinase nas-4 [Episyrphus balteatus]|uniref:zinc metalloproteinase nas-4 n=1 Tax=Episyrphus balteatus TaxID=286459 RepID=UPI0024853E3F|nr:zinc metalloproteinase nas-4 [Episyrphus balteatus]
MYRFISLLLFSCLTITTHFLNAEEYFENYYDEIDSDEENPESRNAIRWNAQKWPNNIIPYTYSDDYTLTQRDTVDQALKYFNDNTCVKFEKRNNSTAINGQRVVLYTTSGKHCGTRVGYQTIPSTVHNVYLSPLCLTIPGAVQHETMHVMGIFHEQSRFDRDEYIDIDWTNIHVKNYHNFIKVPVEYAKPYDVTYDYGSIMHYSEYAFAKDPRKKSIKVRPGKVNPYSRLGQLKKPSDGDIQKINRMYGC